MLGVNSEGFTADKARRVAAEWHAKVRLGEDPGGDRVRERRAEMFAEPADLYLTEHAHQHKRPSSAAADERNLRNHLIPLIGPLKVRTIQPNDINRALRAIADGKTAREERIGPRAVRKVTGGKGAANRCRALLSKMLGEFAEQRGMRMPGSNPCARIAAVALANKLDRTVWALLRDGGAYRTPVAVAHRALAQTNGGEELGRVNMR